MSKIDRGITAPLSEVSKSQRFPEIVVFVGEGRRVLAAKSSSRRRVLTTRVTPGEEEQTSPYFDVQRVQTLLAALQRDQVIYPDEISRESGLSPETIAGLLSGTRTRITRKTEEGLVNFAKQYRRSEIAKRLLEELEKPRKGSKREEVSRSEPSNVLGELQTVLQLPGVTQRKVAQLAGISTAYFAQLVNGVSFNPRPGVCDRLLRAIDRIKEDEAKREERFRNIRRLR